MKNKLMSLFDKLLLRKRAVIESVNNQLKNISQIEHSRHRSISNFMVNLLSGIAAYALQQKKSRLKAEGLLDPPLKETGLRKPSVQEWACPSCSYMHDKKSSSVATLFSACAVI